MTLKLYDKGPRVLRVEAIAHNTKALRCGKLIEKLPIMLNKLQDMVIGFLNVVQAVHCSFLTDDALDSLIKPVKSIKKARLNHGWVTTPTELALKLGTS